MFISNTFKIPTHLIYLLVDHIQNLQILHYLKQYLNQVLRLKSAMADIYQKLKV